MSNDPVRLAFAQRFGTALNNKFWGVVCAKYRGRIVFEEGHGTANRAGLANDGRTLFEISSVSKQFTAAALLRLEMDASLRIDDPIDMLIEHVPDDKRLITVRHLLTHTSGIDPDFGVAYASQVSRAEFMRLVLERPLAHGIGAGFAYANVNYSLLAAIIELASGLAFETYLRRALFDRAGLQDTGLIGTPSLIASARDSQRMAFGRRQGTAANWHWGWGYRGMGGVVTTARDLMTWDAALSGNAVLSDAAKQAMFAPGLGGYGLGWFVEMIDNDRLRVWHSGSVCGYEALFVRYPGERTALVVLANEAYDLERIEEAFEDALCEIDKSGGVAGV